MPRIAARKGDGQGEGTEGGEWEWKFPFAPPAPHLHTITLTFAAETLVPPIQKKHPTLSPLPPSLNFPFPGRGGGQGHADRFASCTAVALLLGGLLEVFDEVRHVIIVVVVVARCRAGLGHVLLLHLLHGLGAELGQRSRIKWGGAW